MRKRNYIYLFIISTSIIYLIISISLVERSALIYIWEFPIEYLIGVFIVIVLVKYSVIYGFLRSYNLKGDLFLSVLLVNLVSVPLGQLIFIYFPTFLTEYLILFYFMFLIIEIGTVVSDWLLFRIEFNRFEQLELIDLPLSSKKVLKISIVANVMSFLTLIMILFIQSNWAFYIMRYG